MKINLPTISIQETLKSNKPQTSTFQVLDTGVYDATIIQAIATQSNAKDSLASFMNLILAITDEDGTEVEKRFRLILTNRQGQSTTTNGGFLKDFTTLNELSWITQDASLGELDTSEVTIDTFNNGNTEDGISFDALLGERVKVALIRFEDYRTKITDTNNLTYQDNQIHRFFNEKGQSLDEMISDDTSLHTLKTFETRYPKTYISNRTVGKAPPRSGITGAKTTTTASKGFEATDKAPKRVRSFRTLATTEDGDTHI